jgi:hypothetical protein
MPHSDEVVYRVQRTEVCVVETLKRLRSVLRGLLLLFPALQCPSEHDHRAPRLSLA